MGRPPARPGDRVTVGVPAHEILLAVGDPPVTSARNRIPGRVEQMYQSGSRLLVAVDAGPTLFAEITEDSLRSLQIEPGREVHLLIKATALRGVAHPSA